MGEISTPQAAGRKIEAGAVVHFGFEQGGRVTNRENVHQSHYFAGLCRGMYMS